MKMQVQVQPKAIRTDLKDLTVQSIAKVLKKLEELEESPTSHEDVGYIEVGDYKMFRLKITEGDLNHRAVFDVNGDTVEVYGFLIRDFEGYDEETFDKKVGERR